MGSVIGGLTGKGDSDLPAVPSPQRIIDAQARANRVDQTTPFGNVTFGGPDRSQLNFALSPQLQALFNAQATGGETAARLGGQQLAGLGNPQRAQDAFFEQGASRLQPLFDRRRSSLQNQLEQSGNPATGAALAPGSVSELDLLGRQENDAFSQLANQATLAGPQFQGQQIQNALGLLGGSPIGVPQFNFAGPSPIDVTGAFGLNQQGALGNANLRAQGRSDLFGGLFDLGSAAMGLF